jgi:dephospho-CoA kinase
MLKVGLTGGLACGKSFVGDLLVELGCSLIQADELGHQVLAPGGEAYDAVIGEFGSDIVNGGGQIDRNVLASLVFNAPERLARLNALVHPPVLRREEALAAGYAAREPHGVLVVEAAILIETGSYKRFDRIILVTCREDQQVERAMRREGSTEADVRARLRRQMPLDEKRKFAHFVIDTSGEKEDTVRQTRAVYLALRSIAS